MVQGLPCCVVLTRNNCKINRPLKHGQLIRPVPVVRCRPESQDREEKQVDQHVGHMDDHVSAHTGGQLQCPAVALSAKL